MSTSSDDKDIVVGIDLGTTNSLIAYLDGDTPRVLADEDGNVLVPSVISISDGQPTGHDSAALRESTTRS